MNKNHRKQANWKWMNRTQFDLVDFGALVRESNLIYSPSSKVRRICTDEIFYEELNIIWQTIQVNSQLLTVIWIRMSIWIKSHQWCECLTTENGIKWRYGIVNFKEQTLHILEKHNLFCSILSCILHQSTHPGQSQWSIDA